MLSANYLDNFNIMSFSPMSIYSCMKDMVIIVVCPLLPSGAGELLKEKAAMETIGSATVSCIGCDPMPLVGVQGAADVVTCGPLAL